MSLHLDTTTAKYITFLHVPTGSVVITTSAFHVEGHQLEPRHRNLSSETGHAASKLAIQFMSWHKPIYTQEGPHCPVLNTTLNLYSQAHDLQIPDQESIIRTTPVTDCFLKL